MHTFQDEFEDTKWVIRIRKSKDRQHHDEIKKDKQRSIKCHYIQINSKIAMLIHNLSAGFKQK